MLLYTTVRHPQDLTNLHFARLEEAFRYALYTDYVVAAQFDAAEEFAQNVESATIVLIEPVSVFVARADWKTALCILDQSNTLLQCERFQRDDLCLRMVRQDGLLLRYVKNKTKRICYEAVTQNGFALEFVPEQSHQICIAAIKQNKYAFKFIRELSVATCVEAARHNAEIVDYMRGQLREVVCAALICDGSGDSY